jgi:hypothetical protein
LIVDGLVAGGAAVFAGFGGAGQDVGFGVDHDGLVTASVGVFVGLDGVCVFSAKAISGGEWRVERQEAASTCGKRGAAACLEVPRMPIVPGHARK